LFIIFTTYGWFKTNTVNKSNKKNEVPVTIIVAFRNEETNIINCIKYLENQTYNKEFLEIILVDDHSTDRSYNIVNEAVKNQPNQIFRVISLNDRNILASKKNAIEVAVSEAMGKLILTTDADCIMAENWVQSVVDFYMTDKPKLILSPVRYRFTKSVFQKLQSLEFLSFIAAACGTSFFGKPILCNGANLAYEKQMFLDLDPYRDNKKYKSGDDIFLMQKVTKEYGGSSIKFLKNPDAIVDTFPEETLAGFLRQRVRWASKSKGYKDIFSAFSAYLIFVFNFLLIATLGFGIFDRLCLLSFIICFSSKIIVDITLYLGVTRFSSQSKLMWFYIPLQVLYPFYIVVTGLISAFKRP
jgi:cellulose synthase/poly-beta-1,6-N-acetylglucosamine synthase-like glycosyltransferase